MNDPALQPAIAAARAYETLFVPALFAPWAPRMAGLAAVGQGGRVLDVACGTGVLARELTQRVGPDGYVVGLDPNPGMLAVAEELAPDIDWQQTPAESIPYPDAFFDAVLCQFGLMFLTDPECGLIEMLRVMKSEGRLIVAVWDRVERIPVYATLVGLLRSMAGDAAADALRVPFCFGDRDELAGMVHSAGAASVEVLTESGPARFPNVRTLVEADLRGWLPAVGVVLSEARIGAILDEAERALAADVDASGELRFEMSAHIAIAGT